MWNDFTVNPGSPFMLVDCTLCCMHDPFMQSSYHQMYLTCVVFGSIQTLCSCSFSLFLIAMATSSCIVRLSGIGNWHITIKHCLAGHQCTPIIWCWKWRGIRYYKYVNITRSCWCHCWIYSYHIRFMTFVLNRWVVVITVTCHWQLTNNGIGAGLLSLLCFEGLRCAVVSLKFYHHSRKIFTVNQFQLISIMALCGSL